MTYLASTDAARTFEDAPTTVTAPDGTTLPAPVDVMPDTPLTYFAPGETTYVDQHGHRLYYSNGRGTADDIREFVYADDQNRYVTGWLIGPGGRIWTCAA